MNENRQPANETNGAADGPDTDRREALIKIGKYAAYTAPAMMVTISTGSGRRHGSDDDGCADFAVGEVIGTTCRHVAEYEKSL